MRALWTRYVLLVLPYVAACHSGTAALQSSAGATAGTIDPQAIVDVLTAPELQPGVQELLARVGESSLASLTGDADDLSGAGVRIGRVGLTAAAIPPVASAEVQAFAAAYPTVQDYWDAVGFSPATSLAGMSAASFEEGFASVAAAVTTDDLDSLDVGDGYYEASAAALLLSWVARATRQEGDAWHLQDDSAGSCDAEGYALQGHVVTNQVCKGIERGVQGCIGDMTKTCLKTVGVTAGAAVIGAAARLAQKNKKPIAGSGCPTAGRPAAQTMSISAIPGQQIVLNHCHNVTVNVYYTDQPPVN